MKHGEGDRLVHAHDLSPGALMESQDVCEGRRLACFILVELE